MVILTAVIFLKRRLLKTAKSPVQTGGCDNSKFRYGNDLEIVSVVNIMLPLSIHF